MWVFKMSYQINYFTSQSFVLAKRATDLAFFFMRYSHLPRVQILTYHEDIRGMDCCNHPTLKKRKYVKSSKKMNKDIA